MRQPIQNEKENGLYVFMQYEGYMICRYYTINVNFQLTQRYQIIIYPLQGTSAPALPSEVQSYSLWRRHSRLQTYILPPSDIRSLHRPRLTSSHANRMKTLDSEIKQAQAISSVKQCGHHPKSIAPSKITILLKSLFIAQTKNTVKPCGHHPQSIASNEKQTQHTHTNQTQL